MSWPSLLLKSAPDPEARCRLRRSIQVKDAAPGLQFAVIAPKVPMLY